MRPMATYQIWADIVKLDSGRYFVTVSAVPKDERTEDRTGGVKTVEVDTLEQAQTERDKLVLELGKKLRSRGHVILDLIHETTTDPKP